MIQVKLENCNSIKRGEICIEQGKLNIKYGLNGTGKTTIAKALKNATDEETLQELKSYFSTEAAKVEVLPAANTVLVFNEDFVSQVVFQEDDVIENTFEVFLKTPNYDRKKEDLDNRLLYMHQIISTDEDTITFREILRDLERRFSFTTNGELARRGVYKSILAKQNIYSIPTELKEYQPFLQNTDINIPWIDWKNKGDQYDVEDKCPYCTEKLDRLTHNKRKDVFSNTYKKTESQNLKEILELFKKVEEYVDQEKYAKLISCIKTENQEDVITGIINKVAVEIQWLTKRFRLIEEFGHKRIIITDIKNLEAEIKKMYVPTDQLEYFNSVKAIPIYDSINDSLDSLMSEILNLKREMGELSGIMKTAMKSSQDDINEFLKSAGISYEIVINAEDASNSRTLLRQCFTEERSNVTEIKKHLSWGEKNAFSLVLFMYYANIHNPDLIILDDPISSFDSNKKYAIMQRLFKNIGKKGISFEGKTVLLLTHEFEPIMDFLYIGKLDESKATASFIWNRDGTVEEKSINIKDDIKLVNIQCDEIVRNEDVNIVSRIAFLRKVCMLNGLKEDWGHAYEILSCLIHASEIKRKIANDVYEDMDPEDKKKGLSLIQRYINSFDYETLRTGTYNVKAIKNLYLNEVNPYFKLQLFRAMKEVAKQGEIEISKFDGGWFKFIDETYHIENDTLHCLDILSFNIVPDYIMKKVDEMVSRL